MSLTFPEAFCKFEPSAQAVLKAAMKQLSLSARDFHRVLKLSRTIAAPSTSSGQALDGAQIIGANHFADALQHRPREIV